jgi:long-subunit acyl-CoA synthetase (AMP-forming)
LDLKGYGDSVKVLPYREVVRLGEMSSRGGQIPSPQDTAIIMYTSGSTGPPKGVLMTHANVMSSMLAYTNVATIYENDVYMAYLPLAHVLELIAGKKKTSSTFSVSQSILVNWLNLLLNSPFVARMHVSLVWTAYWLFQRPDHDRQVE